MKKAFGIVALFAGSLWLEQSALPYLLPGSISLRLVTIFVAAMAFERGPLVGALVGFCAGLGVSLVSGEALGLASWSLLCVGWAAGKAAARFPLSGPAAKILLVFGLLALEAAATFVAAWAVFETVYRFNPWGLCAAAIVSPVVLRVAAAVLGAPENPTVFD